MKRIILGALLIVALFSALPAAQTQDKPKPAEIEPAKPNAKPAEPAGVPLTPDDLKRLQASLEIVQRTYTEAEAANARHRAAIADFGRIKAEVIGDHGLAPSKHDFSPDGKTIVPKPMHASDLEK